MPGKQISASGDESHRRPSRFLIACDKFKGTLDSLTAGQALAGGIQLADPGASVRVLAVSDGGQGFLQALGQSLEFDLLTVSCRDALGRERIAQIGWEPQRRMAYIESAAAIGLPLLALEERNSWLAHSAGLGDLILAAVDLDPVRIFIGLGGSASCDGGLGCLEALGFGFFDAAGEPLPGVPASLERVGRIIVPPRAWPPVSAICDVSNPALGPMGGVQVYSPQKGADAATVAELERGMTHWLNLLQSDSGQVLHSVAGAGAAGCLGLGLHAGLGAELLPGADWILDRIGFEPALSWADRVISGEGAVDASSLQGKITGRILALAQRAGKPITLVSGQPITIEIPCPSISLQDCDRLCETSADRSIALLEQIGRELSAT